MRILVIGNIVITQNIILRLLNLKCNIVGVVSGKKKLNSDFADIKKTCRKKNLSHYFTRDINNEATFKWIYKKKPDFIFCFGWSRLIKNKLLKVFKNKIIGMHPAKLPYNRGRHPLIWPIILGMKQSALTFFLLDKGVDTGQILDQKIFKISKTEKSYTLYQKVNQIALNRLPKILSKLKNLKIKNIKLISPKGNFWRKRNVNDGIVDWRMSAVDILKLINALNKPYIGCQFIYKKKLIKIWKGKILKSKKFHNIEYGKVIKKMNNSYLIKCADYPILISNLEPNVNLKVGCYL